MNLSQARVELMARGFDYVDPTSRLDLMLNDALQEMQDYWEWPWLRKTVTGTAPLQISDLRSVLKVTDAQGNEITGISDYDDFDPTATGTPSNWWINDTSGTPTLTGYPSGTATWTVRYESDIATLVSDGDTPSIPAQYNRVWIDLAAALAYEDSDNFPAASAIRNRANQRLMQLVERYETRDMQTSPQRGTRSLSIDD